MDPLVLDGNAGYLEALYEEYLKDPFALPEEWRAYFSALHLAQPGEPLEGLRRERPPQGEAPGLDAGFYLKVARLQEAYRERGHLVARIDPLGRPRPWPKDLTLEHHGLLEADLDRPLPPTFGAPTLRTLLLRLQAAYTGSLGVELAHLDEPEEREWLIARLEGERPALSPEVRQRVLRKLQEASLFEEFLQKKYLGAKTFSLEGLEALVPLLAETLNEAARWGVKEVVLGMAHRGRLNVLANVVGKPFDHIFREFEEIIPEGYSGDVKYHLGYSRPKDPPRDGPRLLDL